MKTLTPTILLLFIAALLATGCRTGEVPAEAGPSADPRAALSVDESHVIVHLFEWPWADVAAECEAYLGPMGYDAVQVSPPSENAVVEGRPWWERYQPVSYQLETRGGDRAAFADMVRRCSEAGVAVYVDAVINHMTGVYAGVGTAGTRFGEYDYPGLYDYDDFHHCGLAPGDDIEDYQDAEQVQECELVNLADLDTGSEEVQARLVEYLNDLVGLGVAGFRIDAARHVAPDELAAIVERVEGDPFIYQEVSNGAPQWVEPYLPIGAVTNFPYSFGVSDVFREGELGRLEAGGDVWDAIRVMPSSHALVFVDNHDNQRGHGPGGGVVTHKDGALYDLAVAFMLAHPYGIPRVMSSYAFESDRQGPPMDEQEQVLGVHTSDEVACFEKTWQCEHRRPVIAGMVGFREAVAGAREVQHWWEGRDGQIAFARGDQGFVVLNRSDAPLRETLQTGLAPGAYCDVTAGPRVAGSDACPGGTVVVSEDGTALFDVPPMSVQAVHRKAPAE